jgi:hypothetical protein
MASVLLSQSNGYRLVHPDQDWRGWKVHDANGSLLGRVADFVIDTDASTAAALALDSGTTVAVEDVVVGEGTLTVRGDRAPSGGDTPPSLQLFQDGTLDVVERVERAVFRKHPVVIEELLVSHDVVDREARIQTTLRRRDVDVERIRESEGHSKQSGDRNGGTST